VESLLPPAHFATNQNVQVFSDAHFNVVGTNLTFFFFSPPKTEVYTLTFISYCFKQSYTLDYLSLGKLTVKILMTTFLFSIAFKMDTSSLLSGHTGFKDNATLASLNEILETQ
jgi:hypothetical protein